MTKGATRKAKTTDGPARRRPGAARATGHSPSTRDEIARRAYLLYLERGGEHGHDLEDWLKAEAELSVARPGNGGRIR